MFTALAGLSRRSAENELGTIETGKLADFTGFSGDIMTIPEAEILTVEPAITVVGGAITWQRAVRVRETAGGSCPGWGNLPISGQRGRPVRRVTVQAPLAIPLPGKEQRHGPAQQSKIRQHPSAYCASR